MKNDPFQRYMLSKNITGKRDVELQLSDSSNDHASKLSKPTKQRQLKIDQLFNNRTKNKSQTLSNAKNGNNNSTQKQAIEEPSDYKWVRPQQKKHQEARHRFSQATQQLQDKIKSAQHEKQVEHKTRQKQAEVPIYETRPYHSQYILTRNQQLEQQKKLKKQQKKQQEKKKQLEAKKEAIKRKQTTFKNFLSNITEKNTEKGPEKSEQVQLNNITMFNKMEDENMEKMITGDKRPSGKVNVGLVYKKLTVERQKIPMSFLKLLLSYKFSSEILSKQTKKVPNQFEDQLTYKKTFHYLVINECIADIQIRLQKIEEGSTSAIPITLKNFKTNSDGFTQFSICEQMKQAKPSTNDKQKFLLKNLSLSRNRLGLITNAKNFKLDHYGVPSPKNDRVFGFLCLLVTPQSKQELNSDTRSLAAIETQNLQLILSINKTNKCYFYDLEKISTHLRQYLAISHLYDSTEVASFIYSPSLIQKHHLDMISEEDRQALQPILQKIKAQYNSTQYESIREMVLRESGIVLLQGPPGTGKTTTLMGLLAAEYEYLKNTCTAEQKRKILICAPSNAAIDHITKRLKCEGLITTSTRSANFSLDGSMLNAGNGPTDRVFPNILRVGIVETDDPDIISVSLDDICDKEMFKVKKNQQKRNNMTTTEIKQKIIEISKDINKLKARKDLQEWDIESRVLTLKYEIKKYQTLLFHFRRERIEMKQTYNQIQNRLFDEADIILTTLSSSGAQKMQRLRGFIGCLIVDQAAQSTEPSILIPLQTGVKKVLLIGDPYQLPSTTMSQDSSVTLFNRSLFQRFLDNGVKPYFLNIQYRMAPCIREFPSSAFYNGRLIDAESVIQRYKPITVGDERPEAKTKKQFANSNLNPISQFFGRNSIFIDIKFGEEQFHSNSYRNVGECLLIKSLILGFIRRTNLSIGVITPYQSQKKYLNKELKKQIAAEKQLEKQLEQYSQRHKQQIQKQKKQGDEDNEQNSRIFVEEGEIEDGEVPDKNISNQVQNANTMQQSSSNQKQLKKPKAKIKSPQQLLHERVMINTVDSFQGQQKDIIIVSTVRSNNRNEIGFMKDERRINVALTRSRHLLIVVGNGDTIGSNQTWNKYLQWTEKNNCYYQVHEREGIKTAIYKINDGYNRERIIRERHKKLTKDIRKQQRQEIRRQDFGLSKTKKRVKMQKRYEQKKYEYKQINNNQPQTSQKQEKQKQKQKQLLEQMIDENKQSEAELLQEKRARQQQAIKLEQMNRKIRQLQEKLKQDHNNPYAQLFN